MQSEWGYQQKNREKVMNSGNISEAAPLRLNQTLAEGQCVVMGTHCVGNP